MGSSSCIDLNVLPRIRDEGRWGSIVHFEGGTRLFKTEFLWPYASIQPTAAGQHGYSHVDRDIILADIENLPVGNATLFDFLAAKPNERIPEWCRAMGALHFPATLFFERKGAVFIMTLALLDGEWRPMDTLLEAYDFGEECDQLFPEPMHFMMLIGAQGFKGRKHVHRL